MENIPSVTFANILREHPILLNKSQLPTVRKGKSAALLQIQIKLQGMCGKNVEIVSITKKINNMKMRVKQKCDLNQTGNKKIILKDWEKIIHELLDGDSNPTITTIPADLMEDQQDEDTPKFHKTQIWPEISEDSSYKYKLSALLFIRGTQTRRKFLLASHIGKLNVECTNSEGDQGLVESFNDIIFIDESQGGVKSCSFVLVKCTSTEFIVKHSDLISTKGSFSLHSLFASYLQIKSLFDSGELDYMQVTFENCKFILYTNALFAFQEQNESVLEENIFSTNDSGFVLAKYCKLISENSVVGMDFQSFIEKLQFFYSQANENKLDQLLYKHFSHLYLQPESLVELFYKQFIHNFQNWWEKMGECLFLTEKSSILDKVFSDYILFLNSKKQKEVDVIRIKFTEETIQQLKENITNTQCHIETLGEGSMLVSMYKVHHVLRFLGHFKWYIFVGSKEAYDLRLQLMSIWKSHYCSYLGIVVELEINLQEFIELIILIRDVLQNQHSKRVVFLIKETTEYFEINTTLRKYFDL